MPHVASTHNGADGQHGQRCRPPRLSPGAHDHQGDVEHKYVRNALPGPQVGSCVFFCRPSGSRVSVSLPHGTRMQCMQSACILVHLSDPPSPVHDRAMCMYVMTTHRGPRLDGAGFAELRWVRWGRAGAEPVPRKTWSAAAPPVSPSHPCEKSGATTPDGTDPRSEIDGSPCPGHMGARNSHLRLHTFQRKQREKTSRRATLLGLWFVHTLAGM